MNYFRKDKKVQVTYFAAVPLFILPEVLHIDRRVVEPCPQSPGSVPCLGSRSPCFKELSHEIIKATIMYKIVWKENGAYFRDDSQFTIRQTQRRTLVNKN